MKMSDFMSNFNEAIKRKKELVAKTDYIEWLYDFTDAHPDFADNQWLYENPKRISDDDYEKVKLLTDFFTAIDEYCVVNLIASLGTERDYCYVVKYKDKYFTIGVCIGQGAFNYVCVSKEVTTEYILFESIMKNSKDAKLDTKLDKLAQAKELVAELKSLGMPEEEVIKMIRNTYKKDIDI